MAHVDIGGGEADGAAQLVAMLDHPLYGEGAGQQAGGGFAIAGFERLADAGGGDDFPILSGDGGHGLNLQSQGRAEFRQGGDGTGAVAEAGGNKNGSW